MGIPLTSRARNAQLSLRKVHIQAPSGLAHTPIGTSKVLSVHIKQLRGWFVWDPTLHLPPTMQALQRRAAPFQKACKPAVPQSLPNGRRKLQVQAKTSAGEKVGFKWDGSNLRWVRDDRYAESGLRTVKPMSGVEYTVWPIVHAELSGIGLQGVTAEEAYNLQQQGWTIVDVRIEGDYKKLHCEGAINLPLYRFVQGNEFWDNVKKVAMMGFAMKATERDPDYKQKVQSTLKKGQKIIVTCAIGGTLDTKLRLRPDKYKDGINDADRNFGRESRSLKACHELYQAGWNAKNMMFMSGGFQQWRHQGYPVESSDDE